MFFKLAARNSKRSRKEHGLFFTSLLIVIIAFYLILSLSQQDIMIFLATIESNDTIILWYDAFNFIFSCLFCQ